MAIQNELVTQIDGLFDQVKPPARLERITTLSTAEEYNQADLWSWELNENIFNGGLEATPIGFLFFGLRLNSEPAGIFILKRFSPESQQDIHLMTIDGDVHNFSTRLTLSTLDELTHGDSAIELGDAYIKGFRGGQLGVYTPFRHERGLMDRYIELIKTVRMFYPDDYCLALPHGVYQYDSDLEEEIIEIFKRSGNIMTVQDYLDRFNRDGHYVEDALNRIGTVRSLSKMSERMIRTSGIPFRTVGYTPCDFGQVCLADPLSAKI